MVPRKSPSNTLELSSEGTTFEPDVTPRVTNIQSRAIRANFSRHSAIFIVIGVFVVAGFVIPTTSDVAIWDDWTYSRSVEGLLNEGRIKVLDFASANVVFQIAWGALFAKIFGYSLGILRVSTVSIVVFGGLALYGLLRELGVSESRSALGTALYLFNPLSLVLSYTFMTDPHYTAILTIATYLYVRGLRVGRLLLDFTVLASFVSTLAFLVRPQGALIPIAALVHVLVVRRRDSLRERGRAALRVAGVPLATVILFYSWGLFADGLPEGQTNFVKELTSSDPVTAGQLAFGLIFITAMYLGLFLAPILPDLLTKVNRIVATTPRRGWYGTAITAVFIGIGLYIFGSVSARMPYSESWLTATGLGPNQVGRSFLVGTPVLNFITGLSAFSFLVLALTSLRRFASSDRAHVRGPSLIFLILVFQLPGVLIASFPFGGPHDRYLLPFLPLAIALVFWAMKDLRPTHYVGTILVVVAALIAVAGTRDFLVMQSAIWRLAGDANAIGIPNERLQAGPGWDCYWLFEKSAKIEARTRPGKWWTNSCATATDSSYEISGYEIPNHEVIKRVPYSSWLHEQPTFLYLLRRLDSQ